MIRKLKVMASVLGISLVFSGLCGCGSNLPAAAPENTVTEDTDDIKDDITDEEQSSDTDEEPVINNLALKGPFYTGLNSLTNQNNEDGSYFYEDMTEDGITVITNMCSRNSQSDGQAPDAYAQNFVCAVVDNDAEVTDVKSDDTLCASLTYPAYRLHWKTGSNEDSRQAVGVVVLTDNFTFYYGFKCSVDDYEENTDFYESELDSLELLDLSDIEGETADTANDGADSKADNDGNVYDDYCSIVSNADPKKWDGFELIDLDGDGVCELFATCIDGERFDEGIQPYMIAGYNNSGTVVNDDLQDGVAGAGGYRGTLYYLEGKGLLHESMTYAPFGIPADTVYVLNDGKIEVSDQGSFSLDSYENSEEEGWDPLDHGSWIWNEKTVTEEDYKENLRKATENTTGLPLSEIKWKNKDTILEELKK